jgi:glycine oxidase
MLAPVAEADPGERELLALGLESARRWPAFAAELEEASGQGVGYRTCGTLVVATTATPRRPSTASAACASASGCP